MLPCARLENDAASPFLALLRQKFVLFGLYQLFSSLGPDQSSMESSMWAFRSELKQLSHFIPGAAAFSQCV